MSGWQSPERPICWQCGRRCDTDRGAIICSRIFDFCSYACKWEGLHSIMQEADIDIEYHTNRIRTARMILRSMEECP